MNLILERSLLIKALTSKNRVVLRDLTFTEFILLTYLCVGTGRARLGRWTVHATKAWPCLFFPTLTVAG